MTHPVHVGVNTTAALMKTMSAPAAPHIASFSDRRDLALSHLLLTRERRDGFLSDSDILDAADLFTIDAPYADEEDPADRDRLDYEQLRDDLDQLAYWYTGAKAGEQR